MDDMDEIVDFSPIKVTCTTTDCSNNLHCFNQDKVELKQKREKNNIVNNTSVNINNSMSGGSSNNKKINKSGKKGAGKNIKDSLTSDEEQSNEEKELYKLDIPDFLTEDDPIPENISTNIYGPCIGCGDDPIDWEKVHQNDFREAKQKLEDMRIEYIRDHYWKIDIEQHAINYALRKGRTELKNVVKKRLIRSVGNEVNFREGIQTPFKGANPIFYAQHATATCCRECMNLWHKIPPGTKLNEDELDYLTNLIMIYINDRIPSLGENGIKVPRIKKEKSQ